MSGILEICGAFLVMTLLSALGAPRLWLCGLAGLALHPVAAFAVSVSSALIGNYAIFAACRGKVAQRFIEWLSSRRVTDMHLPQLNVGISGVVLMRQMPGPCALITIFLARSKVRARDFLIGSLIGFLPTTILTILATGTAATYLPKNIVAWTTVTIAVIAAAVWMMKIRGRPDSMQTLESAGEAISAADRRECCGPYGGKD